LVTAVVLGDEETVEQRLSARAFATEELPLAFNWAIYFDHPTIFWRLSARYALPPQALHEALYYRRVPLIKELIARTPNINALQVNGYTPLAIALQLNQLDHVAAILARGANPNQVILQSHTPLSLAIQSGTAEAVKLLLRHGANPRFPSPVSRETALELAVRLRRMEAVKAIVGHDPQTLHAPNFLGQGPLHQATLNRDPAMVRLLVGLGADQKMKDRQGLTANQWEQQLAPEVQ
jgi:ankyrin repeat protein